ncbi:MULTISPECIES: c-type cytochrome [Vibrio]|jgi:cytochrome c553|uniref:Cytochrome C n=1 Tax=Vibrio natriegens NBRC 15636 = ATCC 14048 = DSM 759 TaxID=1219067 RepID=A0AAN0XZY0_VIBNA|nr:MULTISPECIES: c-type cytochrome [Vibrio]MEE3878895.1 c-type cytochrome [Vibrio sp. YYF0003]WMN87396.1 cytochrome c4 [Vibrio parahaemolyticus]CAH0531090.1 Cytochrome c4 [Catenococcus thiocycli]AEX20599.1 cytochrome c4 [Vibrio sp. EJY3]ALR16809.1 cytochrome C [Vibrio natriegens NBRC 15636 = ATCC 14048 = DSM 759]
MKKLALILSVLASCSVWAQGSIEAGKAKSQTCVACHGADGNSAIAMYPKLAGQHAKYLEKQLQDLKLGMTSGGKQGRYDPVMSGMAMPLSDEDIADLSAYFASLPTSENSTPENVVEKGKVLYTAGDAERGLTACIACHGARGNGTELSGFPKISGQHADYIKAQLTKFRDGSRGNDMNAMMRDIAKKMTDEDIEVLSQYVGGLH